MAKRDLLDKLNKQQKAAILHFNGPLAIIAGAGSGKTMTITYKIAYLIKEKGVAPNKIMAVTFTNKAANEMKERVIKLVGKKGHQAHVSTYHSWCVRFLRWEIERIGFPSRFNILDVDAQKRILGSIYKKEGLRADVLPYKGTINYISKNKVNGISPEEALEEATNDTERVLANVYKQYQTTTKEYKSLDFDDLIIYTREILYKFPDVAKAWKNKYEYIVVDEFQDTSRTQYEIIKKISDGHNLTIVGDPDQTIYTWRGADDTLITNFRKKFSKAAIIKLEENYRSRKEILEKANLLIQNNKNRIPKKLFTKSESRGLIDFHYARNDTAEARWVLAKIVDLQKRRVRLNDIAILYRAQYLSQPIEKLLAEHWIKYIVVGGYKFYKRAEVVDVISLLKILAFNDEFSFNKMLNRPPRGMGEVAQGKLSAWAKDQEQPLVDALLNNFTKAPITKIQKEKLATFINTIKKHQLLLEKAPIYKVIDSLIKEINYVSIWKNDDEKVRIENIKRLVLSIKEWEEKNPKGTLADYLQEVALYTENDEWGEGGDFLRLMTVHTSKGLEFKHVFLVGFNEGVFPSKRSLDEGGDIALEEERRLAYVAITRAKESINISTSRGYTLDYTTQKKPSRFIDELEIDIRDFTSEFIAPTLTSQNYKNNTVIRKGDKVKHITFGKGKVLKVSGDLATIKFKKPHGEKTLVKTHKSISKVG